MSQLTYIFYPPGTGGNFLRNLLLLDKTPLNFTPESYKNSLLGFLRDDTRHHTTLDLSKETLQEYVNAGKHMIIEGHYYNYDSLKTFLRHKILQNMIIIKCTTVLSKQMLHERRLNIAHRPEAILKEPYGAPTRLKDLEATLNDIFPTHMMATYPDKNILCFEFSELHDKRSYVEVLRMINQKFSFDIPIPVCEEALDLYYKNKFQKVNK